MRKNNRVIHETKTETPLFKLSDAAKELFSNSLKIKDLRCTKKFCWKINLCFEK